MLSTVGHGPGAGSPKALGGQLPEGNNYLSVSTVKPKEKDWKQDLGSYSIKLYFLPITSKFLCLCFKEQGDSRIPVLLSVDLEVRLRQIFNKVC